MRIELGVGDKGYVRLKQRGIPQISRRSRRKVFYALVPPYCTSILLLVLAPKLEILIVSALLQGFQTTTQFFVTSSMTAEIVPIDCVGRWGVVQLFNGLVSIPAPTIGGFIWERFFPAYVS